MKKEYQFFVYILASKSRRLYTGMTNDIVSRVWDHKQGVHDGFTKKYKINRLVYFEQYKYVNTCINREKRVKDWRREKRVALIVANNPTWDDLAADWYPAEKQVPRCARDDKAKDMVLVRERKKPQR